MQELVEWMVVEVVAIDQLGVVPKNFENMILLVVANIINNLKYINK